MNNSDKETFWQKLKRLVKNRDLPYQIQKLIITKKISGFWEKIKKLFRKK